MFRAMEVEPGDRTRPRNLSATLHNLAQLAERLDVFEKTAFRGHAKFLLDGRGELHATEAVEMQVLVETEIGSATWRFAGDPGNDRKQPVRWRRGGRPGCGART